MPLATGPTAHEYLIKLRKNASPERAEHSKRYFKTGKGGYGEGDVFIGLTMGQVDDVNKTFLEMDPVEIEKLLDSPIHEARIGALKIMAKRAMGRKTTEPGKKELFDLYIRRTDRINNWDLVDSSAPAVVGGYLYEKPRDLLYRFVKSGNLWERRIAIISTLYFIRKGDLEDTFPLAELLLTDRHDLIHKATGWMLREAGKKDRLRLVNFLDKNASRMPRTALRYAIEHFDNELRSHYMKLK